MRDREAIPVPPRPRTTRRELLKMLPLAGTTALLDPDWRSRVLARGLALSDAFSERMFYARLLAPTFSETEVTPLDRFPLNSYLVDDPEIGSGLEVFAAFPAFGEKMLRSELFVPPPLLRIGGWLGGALQCGTSRSRGCSYRPW